MQKCRKITTSTKQRCTKYKIKGKKGKKVKNLRRMLRKKEMTNASENEMKRIVFHRFFLIMCINFDITEKKIVSNACLSALNEISIHCNNNKLSHQTSFIFRCVFFLHLCLLSQFRFRLCLPTIFSSVFNSHEIAVAHLNWIAQREGKKKSTRMSIKCHSHKS